MPIAWATLAALACSGNAFDAKDAEIGGSAGASTAGSSSGSTAGGTSGGSSVAGTAGGAGTPTSSGGAPQGAGGAPEGAAGDGEPSGAGAGGQDTSRFPATSLLDDFNRNGPAPGESWGGAVESYTLVEQRLFCTDCAGAAVWAEPFGADQEVFATLAAFDPIATEVNLIMKAQGSSSCELIEILYSPLDLSVRVEYCLEGAWHSSDATSVLIEPGDQLGARARADGTIEVFINGEVVAIADVSGFPYAAGRIGVNGLADLLGLSWDDFGGGDWAP